MIRGVPDAYYPHEARIRNLTYQIDSKVDVHIEKRRRKGKVAGELIEKYESKRIDLGKIPIMIKSSQCWLSGYTENSILKNKECIYDQGGYFIINGSEKGIVAQERQACNIVQVF